MMARKRSKGLTENHKSVLEVIQRHITTTGYPPTIREICDEAKISSTSVANYYLDHLETEGYIERHRKLSRGLRLTNRFSEIADFIQEKVETVKETVDQILRVPLVGTIVASEPATTFSNDTNDMIDVARSFLPRFKEDQLYALEVRGDSMIDAMVNDGDIIIMQPARDPVRNGDMVAVWLNDRDETTLKYFYLENGHVRLQPANPTMESIIIDDPETVEIHGQVVMILRDLGVQQ